VCGLRADHIPVTLYRQCLIWPLVLAAEDGSDDSGPREIAERAIKDLQAPSNSAWVEIEEPLFYLEPEGAETPSRETYQEFVYFHPFVQRFLYGEPKPKPKPGEDRKPPFRIFRRANLCSFAAKVWNGVIDEDVTITLCVARLHLYVTLDTGNIVLVLELASDDGMAATDSKGVRRRLTLADVQAFFDYARRAYPPYWNVSKNGNGLPELRKCPAEVRLRWGGEATERLYQMPTVERCRAVIRWTRHPPVAEHWSDLLAPLRFAREDRSASPGNLPILRHVLDDRIPVMALIGTRDPAGIRRGDWVRLAFADDPGTGAYPYGETFLKDFEKTNCYDRFWDIKGGWQTRYVHSGYSMAMVGYDDGPGTPEGQGFLRYVLQDHFRRHYFQMRWIIHFHQATLLTFSDRLSQAIDRHHASDDLADLRRAVHRIQKEMVRFTHRYWFDTVSNQLQPQELFRIFRREVGTVELYEQVNREVAESDRFLQAEEQAEQTRAATRLNQVGFWVAIVVLATGILGMNLVIPERGNLGSWPGWVPWIGGSTLSEWVYLAGALLLSFVLIIFVDRLMRQVSGDRRQ